MERTKGKCKDCRWWNRGECRKKSPVVITDGYEIGSSGHLTVYPETNPGDWCGEFMKDGIEDPAGLVPTLVTALGALYNDCRNEAADEQRGKAMDKAFEVLAKYKASGLAEKEKE